MAMIYQANPNWNDDWLAVKDDPAILAWYLLDEPEGGGGTSWRNSPAQQRAEYERVRSADPTRPIGTSHYIWDAFNDYRYSEDFTMTDIYPIRRAPITHVGLFIDWAHSIHGAGHPVWPFIQCYGYESGGDGASIPTRAEERCMVYLALAHGAKAINWFSYYPSLVDTWAEVRQCATEIRQLAPFYCMPSVEPALGNSNGLINTRLIEMGNSGLIITVNTDYGPQTADFTIPGTAPTSLTMPLEGGTTVPVTAGAFSANCNGLEVHVYQWDPTPVIP